MKSIQLNARRALEKIKKDEPGYQLNKDATSKQITLQVHNIEKDRKDQKSSLKKKETKSLSKKMTQANEEHSDTDIMSDDQTTKKSQSKRSQLNS